MSSFRTRCDLTFLDGEKISVVTQPSDHLNAERGLEAGRSPTQSQMEMGMRVYFSALRRAHPDHPAAKAFRAFLENLDAADEHDEHADQRIDDFDDEDRPGDLDPTRGVDSDG